MAARWGRSLGAAVCRLGCVPPQTQAQGLHRERRTVVVESWGLGAAQAEAVGSDGSLQRELGWGDHSQELPGVAMMA